MSPQPACSEKGRRQGGSCRSSWKSRSRLCLLKGCGRSFFPDCWRQRYCSDSCREAADRWRRRKAEYEFRKSERCRANRAEQAKRWRRRQEEGARRPAGDETAATPQEMPATPQESPRSGSRESDLAAESTHLTPSEGHHPFVGEGNFCCDRPGCYVLFDRSARSPLRRFCTSSCYQAMRRVRAREARWRSHAPRRRPVGCSHAREPPQRRCRI